MAVADENQLYTVQRAASILACHEMTVRRWTWGKKIKFVRLGPKSIRIPGTELKRVMECGI